MLCAGLDDVISISHPLVLGSSSPRRLELLTMLGLPLRVAPVSIPELPLLGESPDDYLERIVQQKLVAAARQVGGGGDGALLVADTEVIVDGQILGKPRSVEDAARMVARLVGRVHVVSTRYAVAAPDSLETARRARTVSTLVSMRPASREEVVGYARTGEGLDKAGAYAVQGIGAFLVERIDGSYSNVVGLPVCEVIRDLVECGLLAHFPPAVGS